MARPSACLPLFLVIVCLLGVTASGLQGEPPKARNEQPSKKLPMTGEVFEVGGHTAFLILPKPERPVAGMPWVWYAPTLPGLPGAEETWMFRRFLDAGIAIAGIDVGESHGSTDGRAIFTSFYGELVDQRRLSRRPCLLARSRGGLMLYNWAVEHPESVGGIAGIYPVCDLRTYPGIDKASGAYGMTPEELAKSLASHFNRQVPTLPASLRSQSATDLTASCGTSRSSRRGVCGSGPSSRVRCGRAGIQSPRHSAYVPSRPDHIPRRCRPPAVRPVRRSWP